MTLNQQSARTFDDDVLLYFHPSMENLAREIANKCDGQKKV